MAEKRITLLSRMDFDMTSLSSGMSSTVPLLTDLGVRSWTSGTLALRVHSAALASGCSLRLDVRLAAPTVEDPARSFLGSIVATAVVTSTTAAAPQLITCPLAELDGAMSVLLVVTQGSPGGSFKFTISADLLLSDEHDDWTPLALGSKLTLWVDEHDLVIASGAYSDWGDQSPAGNDFTQPTATKRPSVGQTINDRAAPDFDGSSDYLLSGILSNFVSASAYHAFAVLRPQTISGVSGTSYLNNGVIADVGAWWGVFLKNNAGTLQALAFHWDTSAKVAIGLGVQLDVDTLIETSFDGATIRCRVGQEAEGTVAAGNIGDVTNGVQIGTGVSGSAFLDGPVGAILVCNAFLTASERQAVRGYLSSRYGVAA